jgi:FkbM family methyltransferase
VTLDADLQPRITEAVAKLSERFTLADVGGRWGPPVGWRELVPPVRVVTFDADEGECRRLQAEIDPAGRDLVFAPVALGAHDGEQTLYVTSDPACSSLYAPIPEVIAAFPELEVTTLVREERLRVQTLERWCQEHGEVVHAMKLDVQGAELDVLRGAGAVLGDVVMLELELSFNRMYSGQPLFGDVDGFLAQHGFQLWRLGHLVHYSRGRAARDIPRGEVAWFDSRPVEFVGGGGELFWAHAWYVAADVLTASTRERRLRAALSAVAFGLPTWLNRSPQLCRRPVTSEHHTPVILRPTFAVQ